jgi:hypothetical protein
MALGLTHPVTEISASDIFWGVKAACASGSQTYHLHVPSVKKLWELQPPGTLRACPGFYSHSFTSTWII